MNTASKEFGLMVAYLLPGFIGLAGIAPLAPVVTTWLKPLNQAEANLGAPVYAVLAATTMGMILSCFRWLLIDQILRLTGVTQPVWDDSRLEERLDAFQYLVESHYRYYQFVANTLVAVVWAYSVNRWMKTSSLLGLGTDLGILILCAALFAASRDALLKYFSRTGRLVGQVAEKGSMFNAMYNGNDHETDRRPPTKPSSEAKPHGKAEPAPNQDRNKSNGKRPLK